MNMRIFPSLVLLAFVLLAAGCAGPVPETPGPEEPQRQIIIASHHSTRPQESIAAPYLDCLKKNFKLPGGVTEARYGGVALYLSRFYGYTDLFEKARCCDSFLLRYATPEAPEGLAYPFYHVAMFSFDSQRSVELVRKLENGKTDFMRTRASQDAPGWLNFKSGIEGYRVYFADKKVIFFFFEARPNQAGEDAELYAAALRLKDCLLEADER